jgi:hypothetical protein
MTIFRKKHFMLFAVVGLLSQSLQAQTAAVPAPKVTHTMIDSLVMKTFNDVECEVVVAMSLDRQHVKIIRIDPPSGKYNATYFTQNQHYFEQYGMKVILAEGMPLNGRKIKTVQSVMDFSDRQHDVVLTLHLDDGETLTKKVSIDAEFFRDHAKTCLK